MKTFPLTFHLYCVWQNVHKKQVEGSDRCMSKIHEQVWIQQSRLNSCGKLFNITDFLRRVFLHLTGTTSQLQYSTVQYYLLTHEKASLKAQQKQTWSLIWAYQITRNENVCARQKKEGTLMKPCAPVIEHSSSSSNPWGGEGLRFPNNECLLLCQ